MKNIFFILLVICLSINFTSDIVWSPSNAASSQNVVINADVVFVNYDVSASGIGANTANITWMTNGNSNSVVEYGSSSGRYDPPVTNGTSAYSHLVLLDSLTQYTTYYYRISSTMSDGQTTTSSEKTFKTTHIYGSSVKTETASTTVAGVEVNTTSSGKLQVNITTSSLSGTAQIEKPDSQTLVIKNPSTGWSSLKYIGAITEDTTAQTYSVDNIERVVMKSDPIQTDLGGNIGSASAQIEIPLTKPVSGVPLTQEIIQGAKEDAANAFQLAATSNNLDIKSVAYTVKFDNTEALNKNLSSSGGGVTLTFGIADDWVMENGGTSSIKIFRFGDDGKKEVLSPTSIITNPGGTDYFTVSSPNGLSTFGMTAVSSTGGGDGGNGGGGGGGDSTTSTSYSGFSSGGSGDPQSVSRAGPVQQALAPVIQEIGKLLAPFQESVETKRDISVAGLSVTTKPSGTQTIRLATGLAAQSGATVSVTGNRIAISKPDYSLTITTAETPVIENGEISGTVSSVEVSTTPAPATLNIGTIAFSLNTPLAAVPETGTLTTIISESVTPDMLSRFQSAALENNKRVEDVAYSVMVTRTHLATTGPATVTLTAPPDWVLTHGGTKAVGIVHIADDGTAELLTATYSGLDTSGNIIFEAPSPKGLSAFGLVALKDQSGAEPHTTSGGTLAPTTMPSGQQGGVIQNTSDAIGKFVSNNLAIIIGALLLLLATGVGIIIHERRSGSRKKQQKKE